MAHTPHLLGSSMACDNRAYYACMHDKTILLFQSGQCKSPDVLFLMIRSILMISEFSSSLA